MSLDERFLSVCKTTPIVDCHNDFPYACRLQLHYELHQPDTKFDFNSVLNSQTDLVKMLKGHMGVQFFSCWIECKDDYLSQDFNKPTTVVRDTVEQIDFIKRLCREYPEHLSFVHTADEAYEKFLEGKGEKISITLGVEGLHQVDLSLAVVRQYYELGVRYITLTHNCDNPFATAASSIAAGKEDAGLSSYGVDCIREMNRIGMIVDLSHVSHKTMLDVLKVTKAPVLFSHSSVYQLTNHERNVRDDVLELVKKNGGVVSVNFFPVFIRQHGNEDATIEDAVDHIKYIVDKIGWDHVGLGSDFDGIPHGPKGLEDTSKYPDLVKKVWKVTGATEQDIAKFMGMNVLRVWKDCETVSHQMKNSELVESNWDKREWVFPGYGRSFPEIYPGSLQSHDNIYKDDKLDHNPRNGKVSK
ncbi:DEKNAAC105412 [Brettanomyces naardenensis]|uniref:Dipeptidase n=1 Tax=Brettanomyces naardenensis TaxID=13370 RepID=A0A448YTL2_BRENA|nr:DEKNAAC105412 [Brettanomyces naardenensis]